MKEQFGKLAQGLGDNEEKIIDELNGAQGPAVDIGGYYHPDEKKNWQCDECYQTKVVEWTCRKCRVVKEVTAGFVGFNRYNPGAVHKNALCDVCYVPPAWKCSKCGHKRPREEFEASEETRLKAQKGKAVCLGCLG